MKLFSGSERLVTPELRPFLTFCSFKFSNAEIFLMHRKGFFFFVFFPQKSPKCQESEFADRKEEGI